MNGGVAAMPGRPKASRVGEAVSLLDAASAPAAVASCKCSPEIKSFLLMGLACIKLLFGFINNRKRQTKEEREREREREKERGRKKESAQEQQP